MDDLVRALLAAIEAGYTITVTISKTGENKPIVVRCPDCDWSKSYTRQDNANRALMSHSRGCPKRKARKQQELESSEFWQFVQDNTRKQRATKKQ